MTEELWPLPKSWKWIEFRDVADVELELVDAKRFPESVHIAPNHIESGTGRLLGTGTVAGDSVLGPKHRFERGHLLYSKIRPYLAKAVIAPCDGFCSSDMYPLRPRFSTEYLLNWLVSSAFTHRVSRDQNRTVLPKVNLATLRELPVPLAPINEQRRIVAKLEALQARSRRAREALDAVPPLLEKLRQSILAAAFRGDLTKDWRAKQKDIDPATELLKRIRTERRQKWEATELAKLKSKGKPPTDDKWKARYREPDVVDDSNLPGLPEGWCWASLDELTFLVGGITKGQERKASAALRSVPYLRVANVQRGHLDLSEIKTIEATDAEVRELVLVPGDVLLNEGGDRDKLGRGWVWEGQLPECIHQNHVFRARPVLDELESRYLSHYANERGQAFFVDQGKQTTNLASVSISRVRRFPIALPPASEQSAIIEALDRHLAESLRIATRVSSSSDHLMALDRSVLAKAFRGELVPQHPNDEPAETMLARARSTAESTRANGSPPKRGRPRAAHRAEQPND